MLSLNGFYGFPVDMWSVGCVFGELLGRRPFFPGEDLRPSLARSTQGIFLRCVKVSTRYHEDRVVNLFDLSQLSLMHEYLHQPFAADKATCEPFNILPAQSSK